MNENEIAQVITSAICISSIILTALLPVINKYIQSNPPKDGGENEK